MMTAKEEALNAAYVTAEKTYRVGPVIVLLRESGAQSAAQFKEWYLLNVHDQTYLNRLAAEMTLYCEYDYKTCVHYVDLKLFYRTVKGLRSQEWFVRYLRQTGLQCRESSPEEDYEYGVDIVVEKHGQTVFGIQVKSATQIGITDERLETQSTTWETTTGLKWYIIHYEKDENGRRQVAAADRETFRKMLNLYQRL